ncbi:MAG: aldo/keto reductase [Acetobacteraceae bacterium]|nr:aldo/keto reductase [Acetobacteraceae bacterium]
MEYRNLGRSGLRIAPILLGTMLFGDRTDEAEAGRIVAMAREHGVNVLDTADAYVGGESERMVGRLVARERGDWIIATKAANATGTLPNDRGLSRLHLLRAAEASLARLNTGWIDLFWLHRDDHDTPQEETVEAIGALLRAGHIRYWGVSNFASWRIATIIAAARAAGVPPPIASQPVYNAVSRMAEVEQLPACAALGLGVTSYSPLARGVLTGKYVPGAAPAAETRAGRGDKRLHQTEWRQESLAVAQKLAARARELGLSPAQYALAWVLKNPLVTGVIAGPRTLEQWRDYLGAPLTLPDEDEQLVDALVAPGHPSTPGYTDPIYPVRGRPAGGAR